MKKPRANSDFDVLFVIADSAAGCVLQDFEQLALTLPENRIRTGSQCFTELTADFDHWCHRFFRHMPHALVTGMLQKQARMLLDDTGRSEFTPDAEVDIFLTTEKAHGYGLRLKQQTFYEDDGESVFWSGHGYIHLDLDECRENGSAVMIYPGTERDSTSKLPPR